MPQLSDPLGAPKIVTGPEYLDALARLGYNVENMSSPLPIMAKVAAAGTSFIDNVYKQNLDYQKAQSDMTLATARANNIDSETDYNRQSLDTRLKTLDLDRQLKANQARFSNETIESQIAAAKHENEIAPAVADAKLASEQAQQKDNELKLQQVQAAQQQAKEAQDDWPALQAELPQSDDPDFETKVATAISHHPATATNALTRPRLDALLTSMRAARTTNSEIIRQTNDAKELEGLYATHDITADDASKIHQTVQNPAASAQVLARGRATKWTKEVRSVLDQMPRDPAYQAQLPAGVRTQLGQLQDMMTQMTGILGRGSDGLNEIASGQHLQLFDNDGNLAPGLQGDLTAIRNYLSAAQKQAEKERPTIKVKVRVPDPTDPAHPLEEYETDVPLDEAGAGSAALNALRARVEARGGTVSPTQQQPGTTQATPTRTGLAARIMQDPYMADLARRAYGRGDQNALQELNSRLQAAQRGMQEGGPVSQYGTTDAPGSTDTVPAMLSPGEYVLNAGAARSIGPHALDMMNRTGQVPGGLQPLPGSPLQPMQMPNLAKALETERPEGGIYPEAAAAGTRGQPATPSGTAGFFLNPATGSYERLETRSILNPATGSYEPMQTTAPPSSAASGNWKTGRGTEFGEVDNPKYGGYTEPNWNVGKWGDKISGWDTEGVALPNVARGTIVEIRNPRTGQTVRAPVKDHGPAAGTGAAIDLLAGTRAKLGLPKNSSYNLEFRIVSGMQAGGIVPDPETGMDLSQSGQDALTASILAGQTAAAQAGQAQGYQRGGMVGGTELGGEGGARELGGGGTELGGSDMMPAQHQRHRRFRPRMPGQQQGLPGPDIPDEMQRKLAKLSHDYLSGLSGLIQSKPQLGPALLRHARNQLASNIGSPGEEEQMQQQPMRMPSDQTYSPAQYAMTASEGQQEEEA